MIGIGVDIEKTDRFKKKLKDKRFLNKIFTQEELNYCFSNKYPEKHLAARFAGKEAMIKAYCSLYKDITVYCHKGQPHLVKKSARDLSC